MMADAGRATGASRIDLAQTDDFDLGGMRVSPSHREVSFNGKRRELEPRVLQVLVALASARPGVVPRDRLIEQCWDGRIVGDDAINRCIVALRHLAKEFTPEPFAIETVPRIGYSLVERRREAGWANRVLAHPRLTIATLFGIFLIGGTLFFAWWRYDRGEAAPASIAVLSFRNLSSGDPYFAEGVGEEILGQLAREPQFRVAGRASSTQFGKDPDVREVGRRLGVDYVLEGSVRTQGNKVRVNADLVRASDGFRMWANSYNGSLDDVFAIQQQIGQAIALSLRRKLVRAPLRAGARVANSDAYNLYLTGRGLIRTRDRRAGPIAAGLLRDAVKLDPGYAPAWANLAIAVQMEAALKDHETFLGATKQAQRYARHAVRLAPDLAEAHRTLGMVLGYGDPQAQVHVRRAAELEPNDAETMIALGAVHSAAAEFTEEVAAYRRAGELDPLWFRTTGASAIAMSYMGDRNGAESFARRSFADNPIQLNLVLGRIAWIFGDFSEATKRWTAVVRSGSSRWADPAQRTLNEAKFAVGLGTGIPVTIPPPIHERPVWRIWMDVPPTADIWNARNRDAVAAVIYRGENLVGAKLMLNAGRARELAAAYGTEVGLLGHRRGQRLRPDQLGATPTVALALRAAGRSAEADQVLRAANVEILAIYRRGPVPFWFDADTAALFAVQGRTDEALSMLERAINRGWTYSGGGDLRNFAAEPAFRSLHGQRGFERVRARLAAHYVRERLETMRLRI